MTAVAALLVPAADRLAAAGVESARVDAELLLAHCLGVPRSRLALVDAVPPAVASGFEHAVARRSAREPLQHITGTAPFRTVELAVGPGVFVPRPETELLVDAVLPLLRATAEPTVVDLCSGSGALALAVATEVPSARVYAVERSADALSWLRRNTAGTTVEVVAGDVTDPQLLIGLGASVDAIVANPPYVPAATAVAAEVRADPEEAVFAGADGLAVLPHVLARAAGLLRADGILAMEHDETHADAVHALLAGAAEWSHVQVNADLSGRARYVTARRRAGSPVR